MSQGALKRQGDVLVVAKSRIPNLKIERGTSISKDKGRTVLAYGEVTGHAHAFSENVTKVNLFEATKSNIANSRELVVEEATALRHDEHAAMVFPKDEYVCIRQREYDGMSERIVMD
jgi:hypothetical protein